MNVQLAIRFIFDCHRQNFRLQACACAKIVAIQRDSFAWLRDEGLAEVFEELSPVEDFTGQMSLAFSDHRFEEPKHPVDECREKDLTYSAPLFVTAEFHNRNTGEFKQQTVFMGDFPMMTDQGTFVINGTERIVVSQLVRSPGVYFDASVDKATGRDVFGCKVIPSRGAWLELEIDKRGFAGVRVDRKRRQHLTVLYRALKGVVLRRRGRRVPAGRPRAAGHRGPRRRDPGVLRQRPGDRADDRQGRAEDAVGGPAGHLPQAAPG